MLFFKRKGFILAAFSMMALTSFVETPAFAGTDEITDHDGSVVGHINENGLAVDSAGNHSDTINDEGRISDNNGNHVGCVNPDGDITDSTDNSIGHVTKDGEVTDNRGNFVGRVPPGNNTAGFDLLMHHLGN
ncbi:5-fold beta-flower protein [Swingsia samuiensis]|uniref:Uncharacterized protein n=1 Tax=Swingsia samuiensis TaxID=1293412 RepID=A0A4Y6UM65_9PROT|nr:hypothetical protein [Swingsia samuiensis]QDH17870.1 hypothetical protein E3D00_10030 [Swingsia samuiensis]